MIALLLLSLLPSGSWAAAAMGSKEQDPAPQPLKYRFEFTFQGKASGVLLLLFRYRFFYMANASVILNAERTGPDTHRLTFDAIDRPGYLLRTRGFTGKTVIIAAADANQEKVQEYLDKGFARFRELAPDFADVNKEQRAFPYSIATDGEKSLTFTRRSDGVHVNAAYNIEVRNLKYDPKCEFYFKIYPMMLELVKMYNHPYLPVDGRKLYALRPGDTWLSREMNYTGDLNSIGWLASEVVKEYVSFKQKKLFRLNYRVVTRTDETITIQAEAQPQVEIWKGYKIDKVLRTVRIRLKDEVTEVDLFKVEFLQKEGRGGFAQCALTMIQ